MTGVDVDDLADVVLGPRPPDLVAPRLVDADGEVFGRDVHAARHPTRARRNFPAPAGLPPRPPPEKDRPTAPCACATPVLSLLLAAAAALLPAAAARADFLPAEPIDGPSADLVGQPDVDLARDGSGAVAYLKLDGGVRHVFVSRFVDGVFQPPERIDAGSTARPRSPRSPPATAAGSWSPGSAAGRSTRSPRSAGAAALQPAAAPGRLGLGPVGRHVDQRRGLRVVHRGGRVGRRRPRRADAVQRHPAHDAPRPARHRPGPGRRARARAARRSRSPPTARASWSGARPATSTRAACSATASRPRRRTSTSPRCRAARAAPPTCPTSTSRTTRATPGPCSASCSPTAARTRSPGGWSARSSRTRPRSTRLGLPGADDVTGVDVAISGRGEGLAGTSTASGGSGRRASSTTTSSTRPSLLDPGNALTPRTAVGVAENNDAYASRSAAARRPTRASRPSPTTSTRPSAPRRRLAHRSRSPTRRSGPSTPAPASGLGVDRAGDASAVFVQGTGDARRLVAGGFDRAPGVLPDLHVLQAAQVRATAAELAAVVRAVGRDQLRRRGRRQAGRQHHRHQAHPAGAACADGTHRWRVVATDRRGQVAATKVRYLRVDATPPALSVKVTGQPQARQGREGHRPRGRRLAEPARAARASRRVRIDFGDGTTVSDRRATHRYAQAPAPSRCGSAPPTRRATPSPSSAVCTSGGERAGARAAPRS